jgi:flagellar motor switch protein FliM
MVEQILSKEEIDALLSAMDSGEVAVEPEKNNAKAQARPYDLTSQSLMIRDQFDALDEVYDKFVNLLNVTLTGMLQRAVEVKQVSKGIVKFNEFLNAFSNPTGLSIYTMEPLSGASLLAVEPNLCFALIDSMFGGVGRPLAKVREFTQIEQRMLSMFYSDVLNELEKAWQVAYPVKVVQKKTETKPEFVNLVNPGDLVLIFVFSVTGEEFSGNIHVCTPFLMLEPVKDKLSSRYLREKDRAHAFRAQLSVLLRDTKVDLVVELGKAVTTIGTILDLEKDDVITIDTGPQDPVIVKVQGAPKYLGMAGVVKGNRAVRISALIKKDEGE